jgi:uncharacterized protein YdeI (BOF family)
MKKLILIAALALASSGAFAQSSQGQGAGQAGTNGTSSTTPNSPAAQNGIRDGATTGTNGAKRTGGANAQAHEPSTPGPAAQSPSNTK